MLYYLFEYLDQHMNIPGAGMFKYSSFRAGAATLLSLTISTIYGGHIIRYLRKQTIGETIRELGLEGQKEKQGTPTMGGLIILMAIMIPCLLFARLDNIYIITMLICTIWMALIGFIDDYIKVFLKDKEGLHAKFKILGQVLFGIVLGLIMLFHDDIVVRMDAKTAAENNYVVTRNISVEDYQNQGKYLEMVYVKAPVTNIPFFKGNEYDYSKLTKSFGKNGNTIFGILFVLFVVFVVTAVSNAANLTDGIDGLAAGVSAISGGTLALLAFVSGNVIIADYLNLLYIPDSGELAVYCGCFLGACIGFLWYNTYPAQVFMGDTGSLMLGGIIATLALLTRKEWLLPLLCGIFVAENLSTLIQRYWFKYTRIKYGEGRRVFLMSPLHHHFQKKGFFEAKIVVRFWIVQILLAIVTLITLKVR
jgi:phospho-N-acetylmuramoyl-pentapeptide-transferase